MDIIEKPILSIVVSESCALAAVGAQLIRDVEPGELLKISKGGLTSQHFANERPHAHCAFEYTYFAHPSSIMEGINIYWARKRIGQFLAKKFPLTNADVVVPVPDSARPAGAGLCTGAWSFIRRRVAEGQYSKKGSMRSFIEPYQNNRLEINKGIIPIPEVVEHKHVVIVDDSIVRGTSSAEIIRTLRMAGQKG